MYILVIMKRRLEFDYYKKLLNGWILFCCILIELFNYYRIVLKHIPFPKLLEHEVILIQLWLTMMNLRYILWNYLKMMKKLKVYSNHYTVILSNFWFYFFILEWIAFLFLLSFFNWKVLQVVRKLMLSLNLWNWIVQLSFILKLNYFFNHLRNSSSFVYIVE